MLTFLKRFGNQLCYSTFMLIPCVVRLFLVETVCGNLRVFISRQKMNELNAEIGKLTKEINQFNQENASFISYEKR